MQNAPIFRKTQTYSEMMFIARKLKEERAEGETTYVNLWYNPRTIYEAMDVAERVRTCEPTNLGESTFILSKGHRDANLQKFYPYLRPEAKSSGWVSSLHKVWALQGSNNVRPRHTCSARKQHD